MFQRIRKHLTPSTAIAFVALIFAVTGGAFAATGGGGSGSKATAGVGGNPIATTAKSKTKTGPRGPRGPAGPKGATGVTGATGPAGSVGETGAKGETGKEGPPGKEGKEGKEGREGKEGNEGNEGAAGAAGVIHPGETLPAGASETGAWGVTAPVAENAVVTSVSFTIPLAAAIVNVVGPPAEKHVFFIEVGGAKTTECPGTVAKPEAAAGDFCAYAEELGGTLVPVGNPVQNPSAGFGVAGTATSGADLVFSPGESGGEVDSGHGTWAVTAPTAP